MVASPDADSLPAKDLNPNRVSFQTSSEPKKSNPDYLKVVNGGEKSVVDKVNDFLSEIRKQKSSQEIDKIVMDNKEMLDGLPPRNLDECKTNVEAWRKTIDG